MSEIKLPHDHGNAVDPAKIPGSEAFLAVAETCKQLSDSTRIRIFWILCHCRQCVINLSALTGMSSPAVCHHLKQLKAAGLVVSHREGKEVYYEAAQTPQAGLLHRMIEQIMQIHCPGQ